LVYFSLYPPSGIIFNSIHNYFEIMFPIDVLRFSEFRTMRNHLSETLMLNDIQITSDCLSRWVVLKRRVGAVTNQRVIKVLFYVNILQWFFVVENITVNAVSVAIGDNGNRLIFEIWWNFFYNLISIKNVADVNSIDSFVSKRNMEEFSAAIMKRFRLNWFEKTKGRHVTYNTRQSVLRRKN
jgi:hypothetical protein